ncbi:hypothetical protein VP150E351_P0039 [Vibrio phage 150E35-1]|nr:hypothetical protein VP150E351_P0039 [Vibrio phage 150E35-1]
MPSSIIKIHQTTDNTGNGGSGGTGAGSIADDMYFPTLAARDTFTTDNPDRMYQGVACAVVAGSSYDYYQWDDKSSQWRDANLIFQGKDGKTGVIQSIVEGSNIDIDNTDPANPIISSTGGGAGTDPALGFELNPNKSIGLDKSSTVTLKNNAGDAHNVIDQDSALDAIRLGSPSMKTYLRTNEDHIQVQTTNGMKTVAHTEDIVSKVPPRSALWIRGSEYVVSSDQLQTELLLMCQPMVEVDGTNLVTITLPDTTVFENQFYIPDFTDVSLKDTLPHIESFQFEVFLDYFSDISASHKIILKSTGDWLPFVSSDSLDEKGGIYLYRKPTSHVDSKLHTFAWMKPVNPNPSVGVWGGYVLQSVHPQDWVPFGEQPPAEVMIQDAENLTYTNAPTGELYLGVDRQVPVTTTDFSTSNFSLLRISSDGKTELPSVEVVSPPAVASGFSYIEGGQPVLSNETILQIASGVYSFDESGIPGTTPIGTSLYVQANGLVGTHTTRYVCGWVVDGGVVIDIDMYNASVRAEDYTTHFYSSVVESTLAGQAVSLVDKTYIKKYTNTDKALNGITLKSGVSGQSVPIGYKGVFRSENITSFTDAVDGEMVVIDSSNNRLNWATDAPVGSVVVGWYVGDSKFWIDCDMYNRFKDIERYSGGSGELPTDPTFNSITTPDILSDTSLTFHVASKDYVLTGSSLDLDGSKLSNISDATSNNDAATLGQVLDNAGIKNSDSNTNLDGYLTMFSNDEGSAVKSSLHTSADIVTLKTDVSSNSASIAGLDNLIGEVESSVTTNTSNISNLEVKTDRIASFNILNQVQELTSIGITDTDLADAQGNVPAQALLFHNAMINNNPDYTNYKLIYTVQIASDLHGFLPSDKGGNLVVDNSMVTTELFKYTKFTFTDNDGDTYSTAVNTDGLFKSWRRLDTLPIVYDITELGITHQELKNLNGNKLEVAKRLYDGLFNYSGRWKLVIYDNDGFYGLTSEFTTGGVLEVDSLIVSLRDSSGNTTSQVNRLRFTYDTEYHSSSDTSRRITSLFDRNQPEFTWSDPVDEARSLSQRLSNLETLSNEFYKDHAVTYTDDLLTVSVTTQDGTSIDRSVLIQGGGGGGGDVPDTFSVYFGWTSFGSISADEILTAVQGNGQKISSSSKVTLLSDEFDTTRTTSDYKYSYIAYPKGAVSPDPMKVEYIQGQPASWISHEVVINSLVYIVLQPEWANNTQSITMTLVQ